MLYIGCFQLTYNNLKRSDQSIKSKRKYKRLHKREV